LDGGATAHSRLKIPVNGIDQHSTCYIPKQSNEAKLMRATSLLLWDEAPMQHKHAFEAVDRTFRDLTGLNRPFGGVVVVMGGDFRQVLPVIPKGSRAQIVQASLNRSLLWNDIQLMRLHQNMRVQTMLITGDVANATQQQEFSDWLKRIGEGTEPIYEEHGENAIRIPEDICVGCRPGDEKIALLDAIYGNLNNIQDWDARAEYIIERAILTPLNDDVDSINKDIAHRYIKNPDGSPINIVSYFSADTLIDGSDHSSSRFPTEYLNKFNLSGIPPHHLDLFVGCPVILLKNLTGGLANGTRLIITHLTNVLIRAKVTTGPSKDQQVLIPRLNHTPSNVEKLPFTLQRRQFPVRPAFGMTINKSQGQTFKKIGIYLPKPVFSHGQLYVALSRVGCKDSIRMMIKNGWKEAIGNAPEGIYTENVVFRDVFRH
jgi:ATP-dependent DNA helicase PIF1